MSAAHVERHREPPFLLRVHARQGAFNRASYLRRCLTRPPAAAITTTVAHRNKAHDGETIADAASAPGPSAAAEAAEAAEATTAVQRSGDYGPHGIDVGVQTLSIYTWRDASLGELAEQLATELVDVDVAAGVGVAADVDVDVDADTNVDVEMDVAEPELAQKTSALAAASGVGSVARSERRAGSDRCRLAFRLVYGELDHVRAERSARGGRRFNTTKSTGRSRHDRHPFDGAAASRNKIDGSGRDDLRSEHDSQGEGGDDAEDDREDQLGLSCRDIGIVSLLDPISSFDARQTLRGARFAVGDVLDVAVLRPGDAMYNFVPHAHAHASAASGNGARSDAGGAAAAACATYTLRYDYPRRDNGAGRGERHDHPSAAGSERSAGEHGRAANGRGRGSGRMHGTDRSGRWNDRAAGRGEYQYGDRRDYRHEEHDVRREHGHNSDVARYDRDGDYDRTRRASSRSRSPARHDDRRRSFSRY